jgi:DNA repair protein RecO (recombination protein O)
VVVHTLSEEYGRRGFLVRIGRKAGMALLLPMNILEMDIVPNPKSTLWSARNLTARDPLNGIRGNLYKNTMSLFLSEVLLRTVKDGQAEDGLYSWCTRSILTLDTLEADFSNFHIRFLLELAGALGFRPSLEDIAPFAEKHLALLKPFLTSTFSESMLIPLRGEDRNALCEDLLRYLEYHTESSIRVHSLAVLREVFG